MLPIERQFASAKLEGRFGLRSRSKRVRRSTTSFPSGVERPVHISSLGGLGRSPDDAAIRKTVG
jgi:hypothetical protein